MDGDRFAAHLSAHALNCLTAECVLSRRDPVSLDSLRIAAISLLLARLLVSGAMPRYNESAENEAE
jgi:hypothetical protein